MILPALSWAGEPHWAFQPVKRPTLPPVKDCESLQQPIDSFILAKLESSGLKHSVPATPRELLRRLYFDLIGMPPTPEEMQSFLAEYQSAIPNPQSAIERVVDRLLASPHYGERWGRHWLDIVRFGQTHGYERDAEKPFAWRYRDYVIRSFNADKPFDQFVREQIAGDEIDPKNDDAIIATGFYRLGVWDDEPDDKCQADFDNLDEVLSTIGEAFLGLTLGCARCHEHKFDPIPHEEYYGLLAFVRGVRPAKFIQADDPTILTKLSNGDAALAVQDDGPTPKATQVLLRGLAATPAKEVTPMFPKVLGDVVPQIRAVGDKSSGRRRALAEWIASPKNPLTARVIVNRIWQHHFGRGLVATPNDLGRNGAAPTHPELLDYLASELIANGWRIKPIHRMILLSSTWQQPSRISDFGFRISDLKRDKDSAIRNPQSAIAIDPDNRLLWRQNLRRVEAEAVRDAVLSVSGQINTKMGGRGIFPELSAEVLATQSKPGNGWGKSDLREQARRSTYIFVKRTLGVPILETLDCASPDKSIATRSVTTVAPQALILLNSTFMDEQAKAFAARLERECGSDANRQIEQAFHLALVRAPTERERKIAIEYLQRSSLPAFCKLVLNLNEFVYVD